MQKRHWAAWVICGVGAWGSLMCGPPSSPAAEPQSPSLPDAAPSPPNTERDATAAASASAEPPLRSSTPGAVQCETLDCDSKTETCCFDISTMQGRCLPRGSEEAQQCVGEDKEQRECDESADCASGSLCCIQKRYDEACESQVELWACQVGKSCDYAVHSSEVCLTGSSCSGGPCKTDTRMLGSKRQGLCPSTITDIPCGDNKCGLGKACCYDPSTKRGTCVKESDACEQEGASFLGRHLYWCTKRSDCPEGSECFNATGQASHQEFSCGPTRCNVMSAMLGPFLCATKADCPPTREDGEGNVYRVSGCAESSSAPKGVRLCEYR